MLIANSKLVPHWATGDEFRRLEGLGLTMYGQMTAGSWIYIGTPGHPAGHVRDVRRVRPPALRRLARRPADRDRRPGRHGRRAAAGGDHERGGLPGRRGRPPRIERRLATRYCDARGAGHPDGASSGRCAARDRREALSIGVVANAVDLLEQLVARGIVPDVLTDQTSAHDALARLRAARHARSPRPLRLRQRRPEGLHRPLHGLDGGPRARHARAPGARAPSPSTTATTCAARRWRRA